MDCEVMDERFDAPTVREMILQLYFLELTGDMYCGQIEQILFAKFGESRVVVVEYPAM